MRIFLLLAILILVSPHSTLAEELNAGFVQGLWYSEETVFAGEPIRIYVAFRNSTDHDLTALVRFMDGDKRIGTQAISALPGRLVEAWTDWTPSYGEHTVRAMLVDVKTNDVGERPKSADAMSTLAEEVLLVDYDTDGDGIGNEEDEDDDGDGVSDEEEIKNGTDPLEYDGSDETDTSEADEEEETTVNAQAVNEDESADRAPREGLEKYIGQETLNRALGGVTEQINETKESLDTYRDTRNEKRDQNTKISTSEGSDEATITRNRIEKEDEGLIAAIIHGIGSIFSGIYTLILYVASGILAFPALVEVLLLVGLLYGTYRLAKWYGRRQLN